VCPNQFASPQEKKPEAEAILDFGLTATRSIQNPKSKIQNPKS
jgi:hypothetical protein